MTTTEEEPGELLERGDIAGALRALTVRLGEIRDRMDRRFARNLTVMVFVLFVAVGGVLVALSARSELSASVHNTAEARIASCLNSNKQERRQAQAEKDEERARQAESSVALDRLLVLLHLSPADLTAIQARHLKKYDATVDQAHQLRDCSPAGIRRYLSGPQ